MDLRTARKFKKQKKSAFCNKGPGYGVSLVRGDLYIYFSDVDTHIQECILTSINTTIAD